MNNQDAIVYLEGQWDCMCSEDCKIYTGHKDCPQGFICNDGQALQMAISALQVQDVPDIYAVNINSETQKELETLCKKVAAAPIQVVQEPSEITDEQAILHLQSTGWMQNHDCEMYKSGLRERLADDSGDYDSLIPCEDTISRQAAVDVLMEILDRPNHADFLYTDEICKALERLPSAQPEPCEDAVSRNTLKEYFTKRQMDADIMKEVFDAIDLMPSVAPKRKTGKWIKRNVSRQIHGISCSAPNYQCSVCKKWWFHNGEGLKWYKFCPECGADMRGEQNEQTN